MYNLHHSIEWSNLFVSLVAVVLTYIYLKIKGRFFKVVFCLLWLLFLPNTAYLFTDVVHTISQWNSTPSSSHMSLAILYIVFEGIGIITFLFAFLPFETIVREINTLKKHTIVSLVAFNFLIAFGVVLGRWKHINSYVIFTNPIKVFGSIMNIVTSLNLLGLTLLLGLVCNGIYFLFRKKVLSFLKKIS